IESTEAYRSGDRLALHQRDQARVEDLSFTKAGCGRARALWLRGCLRYRLLWVVRPLRAARVLSLSNNQGGRHEKARQKVSIGNRIGSCVGRYGEARRSTNHGR